MSQTLNIPLAERHRAERHLSGDDGIIATHPFPEKAAMGASLQTPPADVIYQLPGVPDCSMKEGDDDDSEDSRGSSISDLFQSFHQIHRNVGSFFEEHKMKIRWGLLSIVTLAYLTWAIVVNVKFSCRDMGPLISLVAVVATSIGIWLVKKNCRKQLQKISEAVGNQMSGKPNKIIKVIIMLAAAVGIVAVVGMTGMQRPSNLMALAGIVVFILLLWILSVHPSKVNWRPVLCGLCLQFYFALIILRWDAGYQAVHWVGQKVQVFLSFSDYGAEFVFGSKYTDHFFAMKVLSVVVFFSCTINVMYYLGAMQVIICKIGWVLRKVLGTTAPESLCAAANIFIGQSEAPIMIRPFLDIMTKSELNAVMTGGFATIAGGVMAAYISFGVPPEHLLCASVMNAPCALAVAKLLHPETETSQIKKVSDVNFGEAKERNVLEAAAAGASASIKLVANIAANLIAFLAMLAFINSMLSWFGSFVCLPDITFQLICSYLFMPVAFLMGVDWNDAGVIGELIGIKTFLNEFVAYRELATYMDNRQNCTGPMISVRSELIATYALCGFANLGSIGVTLGGLGPMAPRRLGDMAGSVLRALLGGVVTCLLTASVAGLLMIESQEDLCAGTIGNVTLNSTTSMATSINGTLATGALQNVTYLVNATGSSAVL